MKQIVLIPGDGIGPEVMAEGEKLLKAIAHKYQLELHITSVDWGAERYLRDKVGIPFDERHFIDKADAILFGALGDKRIPDMAHGKEILLGLRQGLDLFVNFRPVKLYSPELSKLSRSSPIDIAIFRENTQDLYVSAGGVLGQGTPSEVAIDESIHTYHGVKRIIEEAFLFAKSHDRRQVMLVDKSNAIRFGGSLWQRSFKEVAANHSEIKTQHLFVDVAAMKMVQEPQIFDVVVTSNLFGDILSDLGAGITGGLGLSASGNINPYTKKALFEPVHGSAPDIAGLGLANPFAMFLSIGLMMEFLGYSSINNAIEKSVKDAIHQRKTTKDIGGDLSTSEASEDLIRHFLLCERI